MPARVVWSQVYTFVTYSYGYVYNIHLRTLPLYQERGFSRVFNTETIRNDIKLCQRNASDTCMGFKLYERRPAFSCGSAIIIGKYGSSTTLCVMLYIPWSPQFNPRRHFNRVIHQISSGRQVERTSAGGFHSVQCRLQISRYVFYGTIIIKAGCPR